MFQILLDLGLAEFVYLILAGIYSTVAKIYDIMLGLVTAPDGNFTKVSFSGILDVVYVVAGVFMLFRVMIAMIQYFINPDQISDSSAGTGKLVTRVVVSIVLLILLQPSGIVLGDTGILTRIENAVVADENGIINKIITSGSGVTKEEELSGVGGVPASIADSVDGILIEDVYAATTPDLTCYYAKVYNHEKNYNTATGHGEYKHTMTINKVFKIEFYNGLVDGRTGSLNCGSGTCKYSYKVRSDQRIAGKDEYGKYSSLDGKITMGDAFSDSFPSSCPKYLKEKEGGGYSAKKEHPSKNQLTGCYNDKGNQTTGSCKNDGIMVGASSYENFKSKIKELKTASDTTNTYVISTDNPWIEKFAIRTTGLEEGLNREYLQGLEQESIDFAQAVGGTFIDCSGNTECETAKEGMYLSTEGNNTMIDFISDGTATNDWFTGAIVGVALIVFLLVLCVDVIIRRLKLIFMNVLAPIPIVSYVDPKDKMFNTWFKMYVSIYLDLFIKLIAMSILVNLLKKENLVALWGGDSSSLLEKFFYIVAILVFAKVVPSMITKVFGIESSGGSFKDIVGMAKGAAGFGAGAALGGIAGAVTGKGFGRLTGAAKGMMMGAGSGSKGNINGGSKAIAAQNARINDAKANGLGFFDRAIASAQGAVGYSPKARMDNNLKTTVDKKSTLDNFRKHKGNIEDMADSSNYMSDLKTKVAMGKVSKEDMKANRDKFIAANEGVSDWMRKDQDGYVLVKNESGEWVNTGEKKYTGNYKEAFETVDANGNKITGYRDKIFSYTDLGTGETVQVTAKYEGAAEGKIAQAEREMQAEFNNNTFLQKELGMQGQTVDNFAKYKDAETIAKDKSNDYSAEIIGKQSSDSYRKASSMDEYAKSGK